MAKCAPASEITLSYMISPPLMAEIGRTFLDRFSGLAAGAGEPLRTAHTPEEAEAVVRRCGLHVADHPTRDDIEARYFAGRSDELSPITFEQFLVASVPA